ERGYAEGLSWFGKRNGDSRRQDIGQARPHKGSKGRQDGHNQEIVGGRKPANVNIAEDIRHDIGMYLSAITPLAVRDSEQLAWRFVTDYYDSAIELSQIVRISKPRINFAIGSGRILDLTIVHHAIRQVIDVLICLVHRNRFTGRSIAQMNSIVLLIELDRVVVEEMRHCLQRQRWSTALRRLTGRLEIRTPSSRTRLPRITCVPLPLARSIAAAIFSSPLSDSAMERSKTITLAFPASASIKSA